MTDERTEFIAGLRALADLYEQRPLLQLPYLPDTFNVFTNDAESFTAQAKLLGSAEKRSIDQWLVLRRSFGPLNLDLNADHEQVCEHIVTGKRTLPAEPERTIPAVPERV